MDTLQFGNALCHLLDMGMFTFREIQRDEAVPRHVLHPGGGGHRHQGTHRVCHSTR